MIVREDSLTLFGFADSDARDLFLELLLSVSGVGPKIALALLAVLDATALRRALADGDVTALTRVPGIGKRGAERLVLELRDKSVHGGRGGGLTRAQRPRRARAGAWKPLSDSALRSSRPKKPSTRCSALGPGTRRRRPLLRCVQRCRCWAKK